MLTSSDRMVGMLGLTSASRRASPPHPCRLCATVMLAQMPMRRCVTAVTVTGPHPAYPGHKGRDSPGGNRRENGMRGLTSNELDLVSGGEVRVVINMGPLRIEMYPDHNFVFYSN